MCSELNLFGKKMAFIVLMWHYTADLGPVSEVRCLLTSLRSGIKTASWNYLSQTYADGSNGFAIPNLLMYLSFISQYLLAMGKTCMYISEPLKSLAGCHLPITGPDRSLQRIPQVHWTSTEETCYFQTKKPNWPWFLINKPMTWVNCKIRLFALPRVVAKLFQKHWMCFVLW